MWSEVTSSTFARGISLIVCQKGGNIHLPKRSRWAVTMRWPCPKVKRNEGRLIAPPVAKDSKTAISPGCNRARTRDLSILSKPMNCMYINARKMTKREKDDEKRDDE